MSGRPVPICAFLLISSIALSARPDERQIVQDAATFHRFRLSAVAEMCEIEKHPTDEKAPGKYLGDACAQLAHRTTPDFLFGVVRDLIADDSRTEDPYFVAIALLDSYPPDAARRVVRKILGDPHYAACGDVQNWLWEIDEAEKARKDPKHADQY
jgi:hypothetical protein